jgi:hypothetical protein
MVVRAARPRRGREGVHHHEDSTGRDSTTTENPNDIRGADVAYTKTRNVCARSWVLAVLRQDESEGNSSISHRFAQIQFWHRTVRDRFTTSHFIESAHDGVSSTAPSRSCCHSFRSDPFLLDRLCTPARSSDWWVRSWATGPSNTPASSGGRPQNSRW